MKIQKKLMRRIHEGSFFYLRIFKKEAPELFFAKNNSGAFQKLTKPQKSVILKMTVHSKQQTNRKIQMKPKNLQIVLIYLFILGVITTLSWLTLRNVTIFQGSTEERWGALLLFIIFFLTSRLLVHFHYLAELNARIKYFDKAFDLRYIEKGKYIVIDSSKGKCGNDYILLIPIELSISPTNEVQFKKRSEHPIPLYFPKSDVNGIKTDLTIIQEEHYETLRIYKDKKQYAIVCECTGTLPRGAEIKAS